MISVAVSLHIPQLFSSVHWIHCGDHFSMKPLIATPGLIHSYGDLDDILSSVGLRGFLGCGTFTAKTEQAIGK